MFRKKKSEADRKNWNFCSKSCVAISSNQKRTLERIKRDCLLCKQSFLVIEGSSKKWCTDVCALRYRNKNNNPSKTDVAKTKISAYAKLRGVSHMKTPECLRKLSATISGENHWNWQGGKTKENKRRRNLAEYKQWRNQIFERDNYTCVFCKSRGVYIEADHIKPWSLFPELRLDLSNGRTLCKPCHSQTETYMGRISTYKTT